MSVTRSRIIQRCFSSMFKLDNMTFILDIVAYMFIEVFENQLYTV